MSKRVGCSSCKGHNRNSYDREYDGQCPCFETIYIPPCSNCPCTDYLIPFYPMAYDGLESKRVPMGHWGSRGSESSEVIIASFTNSGQNQQGIQQQGNYQGMMNNGYQTQGTQQYAVQGMMNNGNYQSNPQVGGRRVGGCPCNKKR